MGSLQGTMTWYSGTIHLTLQLQTFWSNPNNVMKLLLVGQPIWWMTFTTRNLQLHYYRTVKKQKQCFHTLDWITESGSAQVYRANICFCSLSSKNLLANGGDGLKLGR